MKPIRLWLRCHKINYSTPAKAKRALREHGKQLGCKAFYWCVECESYHLTSRQQV